MSDATPPQQQQQPANNDQNMQVEQTQQPQTQQQKTYIPRDVNVSGMSSQDALSAINSELSHMKAHLKDVAALGKTIFDMDPAFQKSAQKLQTLKAEAEERVQEERAAREKIVRDHLDDLRRTGQIQSGKLCAWEDLATTQDPEKQDARHQFENLLMANNTNLQTHLNNQKRKFDEELDQKNKEVEQMRAQLEEINAKKARVAVTPTEQRGSTVQQAFSLPQPARYAPQQQQDNGQINLIEAFSGRSEVRGTIPFNNQDFNQKFFNPQVMKFDRPPNYNVTPEKATIYAMMANKTSSLDRGRYGS